MWWRYASQNWWTGLAPGAIECAKGTLPGEPSCFARNLYTIWVPCISILILIAENNYTICMEPLNPSSKAGQRYSYWRWSWYISPILVDCARTLWFLYSFCSSAVSFHVWLNTTWTQFKQCMDSETGIALYVNSPLKRTGIFTGCMATHKFHWPGYMHIYMLHAKCFLRPSALDPKSQMLACRRWTTSNFLQELQIVFDRRLGLGFLQWQLTLNIGCPRKGLRTPLIYWHQQVLRSWALKRKHDMTNPYNSKYIVCLCFLWSTITCCNTIAY